MNTKCIESVNEHLHHFGMAKRKMSSMKSPESLVKPKVERVPLSARVKSNTKDILLAAADEVDTSLSDLAAAILDDYADYLKGRKKGRSECR